MLLDDEFMLVRKKDNAVIIPRLFVGGNGISSRPQSANKENKELASSVMSWLESERAGRVSFGATANNAASI
jgi:hypothetical protein